MKKEFTYLTLEMCYNGILSTAKESGTILDDLLVGFTYQLPESGGEAIDISSVIINDILLPSEIDMPDNGEIYFIIDRGNYAKELNVRYYATLRSLGVYLKDGIKDRAVKVVILGASAETTRLYHLMPTEGGVQITHAVNSEDETDTMNVALMFIETYNENYTNDEASTMTS